MKTTTSAKALDFTRHTHPGHKGRGFHPKTKKSGQRSMNPLFPQKSLHTEKIDSRSYRRINLANAGARPEDRRTYKRMPLKWTKIQDRMPSDATQAFRTARDF